MSRETIVGARKLLYLAIVNHGRAHVLSHMPGMNPARTEEEIRKCVRKMSDELGRQFTKADLEAGCGADLPSWPMIPAMVRHGVDHALERDSSESEKELMEQAKAYSRQLGRPLHDGDFNLVMDEMVPWIVNLQ